MSSEGGSSKRPKLDESAAAAAAASSVAAARAFVDGFNASYSARHEAFEWQFWGTKMNLRGGGSVEYSSENLSRTKGEMEALLSDAKTRDEAERHLKELEGSSPDAAGGDVAPDVDDLVRTLEVIKRTCRCYALPSEEARRIRDETTQIESDLEA